MPYTYTTQRALRSAFWVQCSQAQRKPGGHNAQCADTRMAFCDWVEALERSGQISEALAQRATLG